MKPWVAGGRDRDQTRDDGGVLHHNHPRPHHQVQGERGEHQGGYFPQLPSPAEAGKSSSQVENIQYQLRLDCNVLSRL